MLSLIMASDELCAFSAEMAEDRAPERLMILLRMTRQEVTPMMLLALTGTPPTVSDGVLVEVSMPVTVPVIVV